jgi:hypothetical protein
VIVLFLFEAGSGWVVGENDAIRRWRQGSSTRFFRDGPAWLRDTRLDCSKEFDDGWNAENHLRQQVAGLPTLL